MRRFLKEKMIAEDGVSLLETLIYITIISLVIGSLFGFSLTITNNRNKVYSVQEVQSNMRYIATVINQDVRQADDVISPSEGNSQASLSLDMGTSPNIVFSLVDSVLYRTEGVADPVSISTGRVLISNVNFANLAAVDEKDSIKMTATVDYISSDSQDFNYGKVLQTIFNIKQ